MVEVTGVVDSESVLGVVKVGGTVEVGGAVDSGSVVETDKDTVVDAFARVSIYNTSKLIISSSKKFKPKIYSRYCGNLHNNP